MKVATSVPGTLTLSDNFCQVNDQCGGKWLTWAKDVFSRSLP